MNLLKHQKIIVLVIFILCFSFLFVISNFSIVSFDTYWHLKIGQDLIYKGLSPWIDHYSFTHLGETVKSTPVFFDVILALLVEYFGIERGGQLVLLSSYSLILLLLFYYYKQIDVRWYVVAITLPFISIFLTFRILVRPEIFGQVLIILSLILYLKAKKSFSTKNLLYISILLLFWSNYHAAILGYVIFAGLFLDKAVSIVNDKDTELSWKKFFFWGMIVFFIGFINPSFEHQLFSILSFNDGWRYFINEYALTIESERYNHIFLYLFWTISLYLIIILTIQKQYGFALICIIFVFKSWDFVRMVGMAGLIVFTMLAYSLSRQHLDEVYFSLRKFIRILLVILWLSAVILGIYIAVDIAVDFASVKKKSPQKFGVSHPVNTVKYLNEYHPEGGNIINQMRYGGYLLYALRPEFKIYIDGRTTILYPFDFYKKYDAMIHSYSGESLSVEVDKYDTDFILLPFNWKHYWAIKNVGNFFVEFVEKDIILFSRHNDNYSYITRAILFPMCLNTQTESQIMMEYNKAAHLLPSDSMLKPVFEFYKKVQEFGNTKEAIKSLNMEQLNDTQRRFFANVAFNDNLFSHAVNIYRSMYKHSTADLLMLVLSLINEKNYIDAEKVLQYTQTEQWLEIIGNLSKYEKIIAANLFENLSSLYSLSDESTKNLASLKDELSKVNIDFDSSVLEMKKIDKTCDFFLSE